jgi:hypothetical protein
MKSTPAGGDDRPVAAGDPRLVPEQALQGQEEDAAEAKQGKRAWGRSCKATGLPDGIFSYKKIQFGYILKGLGMDNVGTYILRHCRIVCGHFETKSFSCFAIVPRKINSTLPFYFHKQLLLN